MPLPTFNEKNYGTLFVKYFGFEEEGAYPEEYNERDEDGDRYNEYYRSDGSVECAHEYRRGGNSENDQYVEDGEIASPKFRIDRRYNLDNL